ncbi:tumor necrosis factor receptor type 1-associated DEATH domain protein [Aythya fuligula]|uniref:Tumor necrosis factor receptor type 1-associated DEATH domain protein n=1 Tax=Aythya fuligula TaxID=219594 RepID=A0A6J3DQ17_AYTFU|nr:tumor necrosis factor receptor type 1-associated DEATH domain protein [Aythya fuligula]
MNFGHALLLLKAQVQESQRYLSTTLFIELKAYTCRGLSPRPPPAIPAALQQRAVPWPCRSAEAEAAAPRPGGSGCRRVLKMAGSSAPWIGSAYLFLQSTCKTIALPSLYESSQKKPSVFKALKLALADSTGSVNGVDMLKVHCSHPHLIVQLKFCKQENCRRFLQSYREGVLQESLQNHLQLALAMTTVPLEMELKAGNEHLDNMLKDEDRCLECIYREKPDRLRDEEITELEEYLQSLILHQNINNNLPAKDCASLNSPSLPSQGSSPSPQLTFLFQGQQFANRTLTPDDHQKFAKLVSKKWKQVGRSLQRNCRALRDPVIDNLALEYDREGLYEQAYQLLLRFIQSEGKKATIARLIAALEENGLTSLAEELLGLHSHEDS